MPVIQRGLRLTVVEARQQKAKVLTAPISEGGSGMSNYQAAKVLGVSEGTVRNDLRKNYEENSQRIRNETFSPVIARA
jgi:hypothetical protein